MKITAVGTPGRFSREEHGRAGEVTQTALAATDMACHDLAGEHPGVPVYQPGAALDREACARHPRTNARFTLVREGRGRRDGRNVTEMGA